MRIKKSIVIIVTLALICSSITAFASYSDIPASATYKDAVDRLSELGVFSNDGNKFYPENPVTREQFAKIMVSISGLEETASTLKGTTAYSDVSPERWSSGYINAAVKNGYVTGTADGKFHPADPINYAQVCTVLVKLLGYTDQDVTGLWPGNYMVKAKNLGLTDGISLKNYDPVPRRVLAVLLDRLLDTNIRKSSQSEADKTYFEKAGFDSDDTTLVYSKPEVVSSFSSTDTKLGNIDVSGKPVVMRNKYDNTVNPATSVIGEKISLGEIVKYDVAYQVSDSHNNNKYLLVVDNKITGKITSIIPSKISPKTVQINNKNYTLNKYFNLKKLNSSVGAFNIGDNVTALLGYDGNVVDIISASADDNSDFALVINNYRKTSTDISNYGTEITYVKLLHTDGTTQTYKMKYSETGHTGKLVKYEIFYTGTDDIYDTVVLTDLEDINAQEYVINKESRKIGSNYAADNIKIFNIVYKISGTDSTAYMMDWSDLPDGKIQPSKIKYINTAGDFGDVNVLFVDNILDEEYYLGMVTKVTQKFTQLQGTITTYTLNVNGQEYTCSNNEQSCYAKGSIMEVRLRNNSIADMYGYVSPWTESTTVEAIDTKRVKVNGTIYEFSNDAVIYFKNYDDTYVRKGINDIEINKVYGKVSVYLDKSPEYGGKVRILVITV